MCHLPLMAKASVPPGLRPSSIRRDSSPVTRVVFTNGGSRGMPVGSIRQIGRISHDRARLSPLPAALALFNRSLLAMPPVYVRDHTRGTSSRRPRSSEATRYAYDPAVIRTGFVDTKGVPRTRTERLKRIMGWSGAALMKLL